MRRASVCVLTLLVLCGARSPDVVKPRHWIVGTCVDAGTRRSPWTPGGDQWEITEVAAYSIETPTERLEIEDLVPFGPRSLSLNIGAEVVFAIEKKNVYISMNDGTERQVRLVKRGPKPERRGS